MPLRALTHDRQPVFPIDSAVLLFCLALATFAFFSFFILRMATVRRLRKRLAEIPPADPCPPVSVIIPARNEERNIEEALASVLAQDYPDLEILVIDDRSTDGTGDILERMSFHHPELKVCRVDALPPGWLGKNHALWLGASRAAGDYLLFTDADVVMAPSALNRAVGHLQRTGLDHLAVGPELSMRGWVLNSFAGAFLIFFALYARPWKLHDPKSSAHIGIGAFNLVSRKAYFAAGTHRIIPLRPDDDMKLGKLIKKRGFRQDLLVGKGMLRVEWYASAGELIRGLEKNSFAGVDYRLSLLLASSLACLLAFVWPFLAILVTTGATWLLNLLIILMIALLYLDSAAGYGLGLRYGIGLPPAALLFVYILWRSAFVIYRNGGIDWRGTHYPLEELKRNKV